jgi:hypothetical protein
VRCFFMRSGHIAGVEELPGLSDEEAVEKGRQLFEARKTGFSYDGFEVWKLSQVLIQYPPAVEQPPAQVIPFVPKRTA